MARITGFVANGVRFVVETSRDKFDCESKIVTINDHKLTVEELSEILAEIKKELPAAFEQF